MLLRDILIAILLLKIRYICVYANVTACGTEKLPCDDGECILRENWCDGETNCDDESDENYCKQKLWYKPDPNKCNEFHFLCLTGVCVPKAARCDDYEDCKDGSDEKECDSSSDSESSEEVVEPTTESTDEVAVETSTMPAPLLPVQFSSDNEIEAEIKTKPVVHPLVIKYFSGDKAVDRAAQWLFSIRQPNYGWGANTARALIALGLAKPDLFEIANKDSSLMKKQLQVQIAIDLLRNSTFTLPQERLALYINALLATCQDPRHFHAMDLVNELRVQVSSGYTNRNRDLFVNPFVILTLCVTGESIVSDVHSLLRSLTDQHTDLKSQDMQVMATLAFQCILQNYSFTRPYMDHLNRAMGQILRRRSAINGNFGNIYSTALAVQALMPRNSTMLEESLAYLASQQQEDGSFGDFLSTYYILPTLARRSLVHLKSMACHKQYKGLDGLIPIETLLEFQGPRYYVRYSLLYGDPTDLSYSIMLHVPYNITFFDIMRLAEHMNEKFRFSYEKKNGQVSVYSIGGVPNDAERGIYWHLYATLNAGFVPYFDKHKDRIITSDKALLRHSLKPYVHGVQTLVPKQNDHVAFWFKSVHK